MSKENTESIRERILALIDSEFESDAAFERRMGLADKTVNNWRRDRSASYMKMIPELAEKFSVNVTELLDTPLSGDASELSELFSIRAEKRPYEDYMNAFCTRKYNSDFSVEMSRSVGEYLKQFQS